MKKPFLILVLGLIWCSISFADNKIILKCKQYTDDWVVTIDLENMKFDMNELKKGIPEDLRFSIVDVSDERIIAEAIKTTSQGGGYTKYLISVTVDRYLGTIDDDAEKIEDTRTDKSGPNFYLKTFFANECEKFDVNKKF